MLGIDKLSESYLKSVLPMLYIKFFRILVYINKIIGKEMSGKQSMKVVFVKKEEGQEHKGGERGPPSHEGPTLAISNLASRYKLKYGMDFR